MTEGSSGSLSAILQIGIPDGMPGKVNPGVLPVEDPGCHGKGNHGMNAVGASKVNPPPLRSMCSTFALDLPRVQ